MKLALFDYQLPPELIANEPITPRDHSRLFVCNQGEKNHDFFYNLTKYLKPTDVLVFNDTKVFPARLIGKKPTGGQVELLLLKRLDSSNWESMIRLKHATAGQVILITRDLQATLVSKLSDKTWQVNFNLSGDELNAAIEQYGTVPIPPYIKSTASEAELKEKYQTVYGKVFGSAAAPTAGFHFTKELLENITKLGCQMEYVTLHVGLGTFSPVEADEIEEHEIHSEEAWVNRAVIHRLQAAKADGRRIIAVGTTAARTLEALFSQENINENQDFHQEVNIFIYPGYTFKLLDGLITNFHLPKSTLLMLVAAFIGREEIMSIYQEAIELKYRFYSFGDGMLLLK